MQKLNAAIKHRAFNPDSIAHKQFLQVHFNKVQALQQQYPQLNFSEELHFFKTSTL